MERARWAPEVGLRDEGRWSTISAAPASCSVQTGRVHRAESDAEPGAGRGWTARCHTVIGGGFIGAEVAAALALNGKQVTMLFPEAGVGARVFPGELVRFLNGYYRQQGVDVQAGASVVGIAERGAGLVVQAKAAVAAAVQEYVGDGVVAGLGIRPNVELAQAAGLAVDNGIVVDEHLCTSAPNVYAAGDVAAFVNPTLGKRLRVEHEDNANTMGLRAGHNMAGRADPYDYLPSLLSATARSDRASP